MLKEPVSVEMSGGKNHLNGEEELTGGDKAETLRLGNYFKDFGYKGNLKIKLV